MMYKTIIYQLLVLLLAVNCRSNLLADAVAIRLTSDGSIGVSPVDPQSFTLKEGERALVVWSDSFDAERWLVVDESTPWPPTAPEPALLASTSGASRGPTVGSGGQSDYGLFASTIQLAPLASGTVTRGDQFMTPPNRSEILSRKPTFRRLPNSEGEPYPPATAVLYSGTPEPENELLRIPFDKGQEEVAWHEFSDLPKKMADGLAPGRYTLRVEGGLEGNVFTVANEQQYQSVMRPIEGVAHLVGRSDDPLVLEFSVAHLLSFGNAGTGEPPLYLADALELIDAALGEEPSPRLAARRKQLFDWLANLARDPGYQKGRFGATTTNRPTGIESIDAARDLIAAGRWSEAETILQKTQTDGADQDAKRTNGLARLYLGVVAAEAGRGKEHAAEADFEAAIRDLKSGNAQDRYRAHNNYANYSLHRAQDRVNNHAFQMAAGVRQPFLDALSHWIAARQHYDQAQQFASEMNSPLDGLAVQVNLARLYALLADVVRSLDSPVEGERQFAAGEKAASKVADQFASQVAEALGETGSHLLTAAVAEEIRAHLAFRADDQAACRQHAKVALARYVGGGHLAGAESIQRLLGLSQLGADDEQALKHFKIAHYLGELLRSQFPQDQVGLTRAGFFARRSFVYEKIVELLIAQKKPAEALRYAELAKARAAQDILTSGGVEADSDSRNVRSVDELLAAWPAKTAALEYFLGAEQGWVFMVNPAGEVQVFPLADSDGRPMASRELLHRVRVLLSGMEGQAGKMTDHLLSGKGFDHTWQDELHRFHYLLIPPPVANELREADQVLIVPHHILHYFPFAALVTKRDEMKRGKSEMVSPKFLLDEPYHLIYAPSLTTWDLLRSRPPRPLKSASAVGVVSVLGAPPLPGVEKDLANFRTIFADRLDTVYDDSQGTEANAKELLRRGGLLLFATHGLNDAEQPLESHLLFKGEGELLADPDEPSEADGQQPQDDGQLTAREIYAARVRADVIVMSACYSGLGDRSPLPGDDLFGLQRAFLMSGARSVVSGLWDVYDGTAPDLIRGMFERVAQGEPVSQALAGSQRSFLKDLRASETAEPWLHPYFWAVYTVAGDDRVGE